MWGSGWRLREHGHGLERLGEWEMGGNIFVCMNRHGEGLVLASDA